MGFKNLNVVKYIVKDSHGYNSVKKYCSLCLHEKLLICEVQDTFRIT